MNDQIIVKSKFIANKEFERQFKSSIDKGEDLFTNHTDKDVWVSGFKGGYELSNTILCVELKSLWHFLEDQRQLLKDASEKSDVSIFKGAISISNEVLCNIMDEVNTLVKRYELREGMSEGVTKEKFFYMQNGYIGNDILWWGKEGSGYTTNILKAHKFTEEQALGQLRCNRAGEKAWPCDYIDNHEKARVLVIDSQYLSSLMQYSL